MAGDAAWLLLADAAVVVAILGAVAVCLGVPAWRRQRKARPAQRGRSAGRRVWTVAELRARENADQLKYYPQSRPARATPGASQARPSEPARHPHTGRSQPAGRLPRPRHER